MNCLFVLVAFAGLFVANSMRMSSMKMNAMEMSTMKMNAMEMSEGKRCGADFNKCFEKFDTTIDFTPHASYAPQSMKIFNATEEAWNYYCDNLELLNSCIATTGCYSIISFLEGAFETVKFGCTGSETSREDIKNYKKCLNNDEYKKEIRPCFFTSAAGQKIECSKFQEQYKCLMAASNKFGCLPKDSSSNLYQVNVGLLIKAASGPQCFDTIFGSSA